MSAKTHTVRGQERVAVDAVAARVTAPGVHYVPNINLPSTHWGFDPPASSKPQTSVFDLRGSRRGRMEIVGYEKRADDCDNSHCWIARCDCGRYERRIGRTWRKGMNASKPDACQVCRRDGLIRLTEKSRRGVDVPNLYDGAVHHAIADERRTGPQVQLNSAARSALRHACLHSPLAHLFPLATQRGKAQRFLIRASLMTVRAPREQGVSGATWGVTEIGRRVAEGLGLLTETADAS